MSSNDKVVQIGDLRLARTKEDYLRKQEGCQHIRLEMDDLGETVKCIECGDQVSAYWALGRVVEQWRGHAKTLNRHVEAVKAEREAVLYLTAAKLAESAWRSRSTVPTCPHCRRGIFPDDRFGSSTVSKVFEQGLRVREKAESAEKGTPYISKLAPGKPKPAKTPRKPKSGAKPLPKWEDAPVWAQWLTQGLNGKWMWHLIEPFQESATKDFESGGMSVFAGTSTPPETCCKQQRPKAGKGIES